MPEGTVVSVAISGTVVLVGTSQTTQLTANAVLSTGTIRLEVVPRMSDDSR